ncbi:MAG: hypothetical protein AAF414_03460 [Pseudomonadota bacterium]
MEEETIIKLQPHGVHRSDGQWFLAGMNDASRDHLTESRQKEWRQDSLFLDAFAIATFARASARDDDGRISMMRGAGLGQHAHGD